ncbi:DUF58 domain-containing protein [Rubrivivax gelatinosus]|uniref:Uncharacterized protein DUF58 n=1 Tax=Rubrivivax gelatinosus TaxID=28068 RepID=A0A4R2MAH1_RUBGE|nr:DUF58 domain-containing protein [Rubrivivax gelatinosus]MBK1690492.1 hypothetical protein [Rubrivivax gelatinosus]TCP01507.1 uncharacterized protein DUF58 [Rubrivivax gelatinosus]
MRLQARAAGGALRLRPTALGWGVLALVLALLLMAVNEANNLLYALAFLLLAMQGVGAWQAARQIAGLQAQAAGAAPVHAGQTARLALTLRAEGRPRARAAVRAALPGPGPAVFAPPWQLPAEPACLQWLDWPAPRRGWQRAAALRLACDYPLGLVRAERDCALRAELLVYPALEGPAGGGAERSAPRAEEANDFAGLRPFAAGDSARRIAWKALARAMAPQVKVFGGAGGRAALLLQWEHTPGSTEQRLVRLTRRLIDAHADGRDWVLQLPGQRLASAWPGDAAALRAALAALALFPQEAA